MNKYTTINGMDVKQANTGVLYSDPYYSEDYTNEGFYIIREGGKHGIVSDAMCIDAQPSGRNRKKTHIPSATDMHQIINILLNNCLLIIDFDYVTDYNVHAVRKGYRWIPGPGRHNKMKKIRRNVCNDKC